MNPITLAALIGGASDVGSSLTSIINTNKTIKAQKNLANFAYQKDLEMWNRSNEYNNPSSQMARLKAAGLNPNLVYGSGSVVGNTAPAQTPKYQMYDTSYRYEAPRFDTAMSVLSQWQDYQYKKAQAEGARLDNVDKAARNAMSTSYYIGRGNLMDYNSQIAGWKNAYYGDRVDADTKKIIRPGLLNLQQKRAAYELNQILPARLNVYNSQIQNLKENTINKWLENRLFEMGFTKNDPAAVRVIMSGMKNRFPKLFDKFSAPWEK